MEGEISCAVLHYPDNWPDLLPAGVQKLRLADCIGQNQYWSLLAVTTSGCTQIRNRIQTGTSEEFLSELKCHILLMPGNCQPPFAADIIITYGLSPRDSLTLSSLETPVLCIQRQLPRPDGGMIDPQEIPLPSILQKLTLSASFSQPESLLLIPGLYLLL